MKKCSCLVWVAGNGSETPIEELDYQHTYHIAVKMDLDAKQVPWIKKSALYKAIKEHLKDWEKRLK